MNDEHHSAWCFVKYYHFESFQQWGGCDEFRWLVGVEYFRDRHAADDLATHTIFVHINSPALDGGFACALLTFGDLDKILKFQAVHEAQVRFACRIGENCWEWLIHDGVPVRCGMLRQAGLFVLHTKLLFLRLDASKILKRRSVFSGESCNASFKPCTNGRECFRKLPRGHNVATRIISYLIAKVPD